MDVVGGGSRVGAVDAEGGGHLPEERETGAYAVLVADAPATLQLEGLEMNYTRSRTIAMPWPTPMHMVHRA